MNDFVAATEFEDLWRLFGGRRLYGPLDRAAFRTQVAHVVRRAPEVIVHASGAPHDRGRLREQLRYVTRDGRLPLEGPDGEIGSGKEVFNELAKDWAWETAVSSRDTTATPICRTVVLSAPIGCDRDAVKLGVRSFCGRMLDRADFVFAHHDDTPFPHAHLLVRARLRDGERFALCPSDLWRWREVFAEELRDKGLEVAGTPRSIRGVSLKPETARMRRLREDYDAGRRDEPRFMVKQLDDAVRLIAGQDAALTPGEEALLLKRKRVRQAFFDLARELSRSSEASDRQLSRDISAFLDDMPRAHTRRFLLAHQIQARQAGGRDEQVREFSLSRDKERDRGPER